MTDKIERNVSGLRSNALKKRQETIERTEKAIRELIKEKKVINFSTVAERAGVSKAWLYKDPDMKARIDHLRSQYGSQLPSSQKATLSSSDAKIKTLLLKIKKLEEERDELKKQNDTIYLKLHELGSYPSKIDKLTKEVLALREENKLLREKQQGAAPLQTAVPEQIAVQLSSLGISLNPALTATLSSATPDEILYQLEYLNEKIGTIDNPAGWLNKAIKNKYRRGKNPQVVVPSDEGINQEDTRTAEIDRVLVTPDKFKKLTQSNKP